MTTARDEAIERLVSGMCNWCAGWQRVASSGEVGTVLDPMSPSFQPLVCQHMTAPAVEFELSDEDLCELRAAGAVDHLGVLLYHGQRGPWSATMNATWRTLGNRLGFDGVTVKPVEGKSARYLTAVPKGPGSVAPTCPDGKGDD